MRRKSKCLEKREIIGGWSCDSQEKGGREVRNLKDKKCTKWFMDMVTATVVSRTENYGVVFMNGGHVN